MKPKVDLIFLSGVIVSIPLLNQTLFAIWFKSESHCKQFQLELQVLRKELETNNGLAHERKLLFKELQILQRKNKKAMRLYWKINQSNQAHH